MPSIGIALKRAEYAALLKRQYGWVPSRIGACEHPSEGEVAAFPDDEPVFDSGIVIPVT